MPTGRHPRIELDDTQDDVRPAVPADTLDELPPIAARGSLDLDPVAARRNTGPVVRTPEGEVADGPTEMGEWQWVLDLKRRLIAVEKSSAKAAKRWGWLLAATATLTAAIAPISIYAGKKLLASERASGAAEERDRIRVDDHAAIQRHESALAEIRGVLWTFNPVGAVRLQGPSRIPTPPPDPVTP